MNRNVILSISGTSCFLDKTDNGYWVTRNIHDVNLRFADEDEAYWFIETFLMGDKNIVPSFIEWELHLQRAA
jgi:hypothetical protein